MAEALVSAILDRLATSTQQEWRLLAGVEQEINRLESYLKDIHAVLEDAEEKQVTDASVKRWLTKLKEAAYELEDVLDECNFASLKTTVPVEAGFFRKVRSSICCDLFRQVGWRHRIAVQIERINDGLDEIAKERDRYQFVKREIKQPSRIESTSFVDVSKLHGRDQVKKEIVSALLSEESRQTISLLGMGGIGKTALAQLIYDDCEVRQHFSKMIWVCVSDYFDQHKIARTILDAFPRRNLPIPASLEGIFSQICENITNTKFFIVLDDVWTERDEDWEPFKAILRKGMPGSRILVTTRKESVTVGMESFRVFHLEELSDHFSWLILSQIALTGKDKNLCETLEDVGKELAKKCKGLPLAAKTLGGLLREKRTKDEWLNVLNSELWRLKHAQEYIFTPLLLSYYDLPPAIRPCFLHCVIFPKDYVMEKFKLISHWMAHGYLNHGNGGNVDMEVVGEEYFNYLASHSLFQDFERDDSGSIKSCKMHDIVYDFVKFLVKDEISYKGDCSDLTSEVVRHLAFPLVSIDSIKSRMHFMEKRRSLVVDLVVHESGRFVINDEDYVNLIAEAKCLRLLEIPGYRIKWFSKKIQNLIHLRYLDLSISMISSLPEEVCELHYLLYLNVSGSWIKELPGGIGKLMNLRYLLTFRCDRLYYYPKGIARLTCLRRLDVVKVEANNHPARFSFGDLENLDLLRGTLEVHFITKFYDMEEAGRAKMQNKTHLKQLHIRSYQSPPLVRDALLQALSPPPNLGIEFSYCT
ncbi:hypothetical protein like AT3G14470 [Hibiscus trionum]|uniref:Disease resistance protein RGA3 n=1 Tax=Hibiscus trionum TaxID=183268 RepID=A0A9W7HLP1_HIBTR|nr:hypothetical protein like AT3G14470 [Hibiscus trionum]